MIHLLAMSVCDDYLLKLFNKSNIEQTIEIEEDKDKNSKDKSFESEDYDDKYLLSSPNRLFQNGAFIISKNILNSFFHYLQIALPQSLNEILIPPPRA